jgi:hypothetical protein
MTLARLGALVLLVGCDDALFPGCEPGWVLDGGVCAFSESEVADAIASGRYRTFEKINEAPFAQIYGTPLERNVWVSPTLVDGGDGDAAALYATILPTGDVTRELDFPIGTMIVHETVNGEEGHGIRVRREEGFVGPEGHGWWFGKIFDDGTVDDNPCSPCSDCHAEALRPEADGLIGVGLEHR